MTFRDQQKHPIRSAFLTLFRIKTVKRHVVALERMDSWNTYSMNFLDIRFP